MDGSICYKDSGDCTWSVAFGDSGLQCDRQIWALKVGGRTGRMAVGVALDTDEVGGDALLRLYICNSCLQPGS